MNMFTVNYDVCEYGCNLQFTSFVTDLFISLITFIIDILVALGLLKYCRRINISNENQHVTSRIIQSNPQTSVNNPYELNYSY